ncbi:MAG TPA: alpha/beta fold hydrolase [Acidimicrobiia bacterium]|nr:alpha/beta fold hydrolase [Acidimicrobiia bacterium]
MSTAQVEGVELAYTRTGSGPPLMLITGLSGRGQEWGPQVELFAADFDVIVPDHPGSGGSSRPSEFTLTHHADAMAGLLGELGTGPAHIVGSSTGGAIAQLLALDHPEVVRSISLVSSWARADAFFRHQFAARKGVLEHQGTAAYAGVSALLLFSPQFFRDHYDEIEKWHAAASRGDAGVMSARIDMILEHDELDRIGGIDAPTLVLVGSADACTPPHLSRELAATIPGAESSMIEGGHLIYKENVEGFHQVVTEFLARH